MKEQIKNKIAFGNRAAIEKQIAEEFAVTINETENPKVIMATGSSPVALYKEITKLNKEGVFSFKNVESFNLDEYLGMNENTSHHAFRKFMNDNLFDHVDIDKANTHFPTEDTAAYDAKLDQVGKMD